MKKPKYNIFFIIKQCVNVVVVVVDIVKSVKGQLEFFKLKQPPHNSFTLCRAEEDS